MLSHENWDVQSITARQLSPYIADGRGFESHPRQPIFH